MSSRLSGLVVLTAVIGLGVSGLPAARAAGPARDEAGDAAYDGGWADGSGGGTGWGGGWTFSTTAASAGWFAGTSLNNGDANGHIDSTNGRAWGLWANSGAAVTASRPFDGELTLGQRFSIEIDTGYVEPDGRVGFLITGTGDPRSSDEFAFFFVGGRTNYLISTGKTYFYQEYDTGIPFTSRRVWVRMAITGTNDFGAYRYCAAVTDDVGSTALHSGELGSGLNHVELFNANAGDGATHDVFFNRMEIDNLPPLRITGFDLPNAATGLVQVVGAPCAAYELLAAPAMTDLWLVVSGVVTGTGAAAELPVPLPPAEPTRFYQLRTASP